MSTLNLVVSAANLTVLMGIVLFRRYLFSYVNEKGKNLATKEDIARGLRPSFGHELDGRVGANAPPTEPINPGHTLWISFRR